MRNQSNPDAIRYDAALRWFGQMPPSACPSRAKWLAERALLGVPLSEDEILHGVRHGILSSSLLIINGAQTNGTN